MKLTVRNLDNKEVGDIELADEVFGLPVRRDILARVVNWQLAKRRAGTHKTKGISDISGTTKKPYKQKGTGRARQGSLRSPQFRGGAVIFGPVVRSHEFGLQKKVRQLGLKTALSAKQAEGKLIVIDARRVDEAKTKALRARFDALGWDSVLIIDGADGRRGLRPRRAQPAQGRRAAAAGRQRLRHPAPRHAGPDPRRGRSTGGPPQMSRFRVIPRDRDAAHAAADVRRHPRAGDHREGDRGVGAQPGDLPRALDATKREVKAAVEGLFSTSRSTRSTRSASRARPSACAAGPGRRSDYKKAIVTLAEGSRIDVTHGNLDAMALKTFNPTTPSQRQLVIVDRSELWKGKPVKALTEGLAAEGRAQQYRPHDDALARRRP